MAAVFWKLFGGNLRAFVFCLIVFGMCEWVHAITNVSKNETLPGDFKRTLFHDNGKPIELNKDEVYKRYKRPSEQSRTKDWVTLKDDRDTLGSSSGIHDRKYGLYGPPEDSGYGYQNTGHGVSFGGDHGVGLYGDKDHGYHGNGDHGYHGNGDHGYHGNGDHGYQGNGDHGYHGDKDYGYHGYNDHREHGPVYQGGYGGHHHQHDTHGLALKGILLPLAGVALLGAAAALVTNPVLLQLGVISGRRKRRSINTNIFKADQTTDLHLTRDDIGEINQNVIARSRRHISDYSIFNLNKWEDEQKNGKAVYKSAVKKSKRNSNQDGLNVRNDSNGGMNHVRIITKGDVNHEVARNDTKDDVNHVQMQYSKVKSDNRLGSKKMYKYLKSKGDKGVAPKKYDVWKKLYKVNV